tara:strand:+ start:92 stop:532 length:441 start_codon:yes stop_codon:yes gene_type:complete
MIINCINCNKKFEVNSELIPDTGRTIQCGSCNHTWFFRKEDKFQIPEKEKLVDKSTNKKAIFDNLETANNLSKKTHEITKYQPKKNFSFGNFLSIIIVMIISFIALIIVLDTFQKPLYKIFPNLELILFNLYETFKDIGLFFKDLL